MNVKYSVGIDISKRDFKACMVILGDDQSVKVKGSHTFANTPTGYEQLKKWCTKKQKEALPVTFIMEATGVYSERLAWYLHQQGYSLSVVLANRSSAFLKSLGLKSKTDKIDAKGLATMAAVQKLPEWKPLSDKIYDLRAITRHLEDLQQIRTRLINQKESHLHSHRPVEAIGDSIDLLLEQIEEQLKQADKDIKALIEEDDQLSQKVACITSIKGVSIRTAAVVIAETNGFALITNAKQLISYTGYDVKENQSGNRQGKSRITKKGNSHIRRAMHCPSLNVVRFQKGVFKDLYERVYDRTGIKMKGYVAVQAKLLKIMYTLWKKEEAFSESYDKNRHPAISI